MFMILLKLLIKIWYEIIYYGEMGETNADHAEEGRISPKGPGSKGLLNELVRNDGNIPPSASFRDAGFPRLTSWLVLQRSDPTDH